MGLRRPCPKHKAHMFSNCRPSVEEAGRGHGSPFVSEILSLVFNPMHRCRKALAKLFQLSACLLQLLSWEGLDIKARTHTTWAGATH